MKPYLIILLFFFFSSYLKAQENVIIETKLNTQILTYKKEIPKEDTYSTSKNLTQGEIPNEILEEINLHRKFDENYLWVVNDQIEILIYPMNREKDKLHIHKND